MMKIESTKEVANEPKGHVHILTKDKKGTDKTGHWIIKYNNDNTQYICSSCHMFFYLRHDEPMQVHPMEFNYCPNCGAILADKSETYSDKSLLLVRERQYLSNVCSPYDVHHIMKCTHEDFDGNIDSEFIEIEIDPGGTKDYEDIYLPKFKIGSMYVGMKREWRYAPEELGVICKSNPKGKIINYD